MIMKTLDKGIDKDALKYFLLFSLNIPYAFLDTVTIISYIYYLGILFGALYLIIHTETIKFKPVMLLICLYHLCLFVSTYIYSGITLSVLKFTVAGIVYILLLQCMILEKPDICIETLALYLEIGIYINCILQFLFPEGLYNFGEVKLYYLFGHQNQLGLYLLIAWAINVFRVELEGKTFDKRLLVLFIVGIISVLKIWSVTTLIGCLVFLLVYIISVISKKKLRDIPLISLIFNLMFFVVVILMNKISWMSNLFSTFDRETNFSGRRKIWDLALRSIRQHPILGVGLNQGTALFGVSSTHNRYLNTIFIGGIVALLFFLAVIIIACFKLKSLNRRCSVGALAYISAVLLAFQFETWTAVVIYSVFIVIDNQDYIFDATTTERSTKREKRRIKDVGRRDSMREYSEISLKKVINSLWHRLWAIILAAIIGGSVLLAYSSLWIAPTYKSSIMVYVNNASSESGYDTTYNSSQLAAAQSLVDTYIVILKSWPVLEEVKQVTKVDYTDKELKGMISASVVDDTEIFSVTVTSTDPEEAQRIANAIAKVLPDKIAEVVEGSSVRIAAAAQLPTDKSGPSIKKYTALGIMIGIVIACLIIIIQMLTDTKIHDEDYLSETYNLPVLSVIPDLFGNN